MKPEAKAKELIEKFMPYSNDCYHELYGSNEEVQKQNAVQSALILANEFIKWMPSIDSRPPNYQGKNEFCLEYWFEVKRLLEKLVTPEQ